MGSIGNSTSSSTSTVEEKFTYQRSSDLKEWTDAEEKRSREMSKYVNDKIFKGSYQEFYEENHVEELESFEIPGQGVLKDQTVTVDKMNLIYAQNWDENDRRVKQGKAVTGSTYYLVQTEDGSTDETNFAYKTKADAIHAAKLYVDEQKQLVEYWKRREHK